MTPTLSLVYASRSVACVMYPLYWSAAAFCIRQSSPVWQRVGSRQLPNGRRLLSTCQPLHLSAGKRSTLQSSDWFFFGNHKPFVLQDHERSSLQNCKRSLLLASGHPFLPPCSYSREMVLHATPPHKKSVPYTYKTYKRGFHESS